MTADIDTEYLLIGKKGEYNLAIEKEDFQDCQVYSHQGQQQFFCGFGPMLASKKSPNCAIQLFNVEVSADWLINSILASHWLIALILASHWLIALILASDWLIN